MKKALVVTALSVSAIGAAHAQSSVTLYGIIDAGLTYVSNEASKSSPVTNSGLTGGKAMYGLTGGNLQGSRWGLRGAEDIGSGMKVIFTLESGFDVTNGKMADNGRLFNRQAFIGMTSDYGTVTVGRQYDSVVDYLGPLSATGTWGGTYFAHPGDNDNLHNTIRINNSVKFKSADYAGLSFSGLYGFSNQADGFADNRAYSFGAGYKIAGLQLAAAYLQIQGLNGGNPNGAVTSVPAFTTANLPGIQNQRTWGLGGNYTFGPAVVGVIYTQSRFQDQIADASVRYNNYELNAHYNLTPALGLGVAYTYVQGLRSTTATATDERSAHWNQLGIQADYAMSKRTDLYAESVVQLGANGNVGTNQAQVSGTAAPSTSRSQVVVSTGIRHRF